MLEEWYFDMQRYRGLLVDRWSEFEESRVKATDAYIKFFDNILNKYLFVAAGLGLILIAWPQALGESQWQTENKLVLAMLGLFISILANFMARGFMLRFTSNSVLLLDKVIERKNYALAKLDKFFNNKNDWSKKTRSEFTQDIVQIDELADIYRKMMHNSIHRKCISFLYTAAVISLVYSFLLIVHIFTTNKLDIKQFPLSWTFVYYILPITYIALLRFINNAWLKYRFKRLTAD